jgi:HEAT repeat protein
VLGAFGPAAKPAIPALAGALKDANPRVRELAREALNRIVSTEPNDSVTFPLNCH